jgi:uncharacterized protein with ParB-like and HNH nuclease domain
LTALSEIGSIDTRFHLINMNAVDERLIEIIDGKKQFVIPVFQRDYSWGTKQCLRLWNDIIRAGESDTVEAHFVGSVVHIEADRTSAIFRRAVF